MTSFCRPSTTVVYRSLLLVFVICSGLSCLGQSKQWLLALSKKDHIMAFVDPATLKIVAKVPVGPDPHEIIASTDGRLAYVSNAGGGSMSEMNVIDLVAQKALPNIDTKPFLGLHGLVFVGGKAWFTAEGSRAVARIDQATNKIDWMMGTGEDRTHMLFVTPDEKRIYTTNVNAGTVSILTDTLVAMGPPPGMPQGNPSVGNPPPGMPQMGPRRTWTHTVVKVAKGAEGFDVTPDGKYLWTAAAADGTIWAIDLTSKKVISTIDAKVLGANRLKFTPDGKLALISSLRSGDLFVFDVASKKEIKRVNIGHGGAGILVEPNGSRAFVACSPDNYVVVVDLKKLDVTGKFELGTPDGLGWAERK